MRAAAEKGCKTMHGLGMLLWQGVIAFEIWTGIRPPVDVMKDALTEKNGAVTIVRQTCVSASQFLPLK